MEARWLPSVFRKMVNAIYETDSPGLSYGFRPGRSHDFLGFTHICGKKRSNGIFYGVEKLSRPLRCVVCTEEKLALSPMNAVTLGARTPGR
jgi:hypothetical protein